MFITAHSYLKCQFWNVKRLLDVRSSKSSMRFTEQVAVIWQKDETIITITLMTRLCINNIQNNNKSKYSESKYSCKPYGFLFLTWYITCCHNTIVMNRDVETFKAAVSSINYWYMKHVNSFNLFEWSIAMFNLWHSLQFAEVGQH